MSKKKQNKGIKLFYDLILIEFILLIPVLICLINNSNIHDNEASGSFSNIVKIKTNLLDQQEQITIKDYMLQNNTDDYDADGLTNEEEAKYHTNPYSNDTDYDTLTDGEEVHFYGTNPLMVDTDLDCLIDPYEKKYRTCPIKADTDGDGLNDGLECLLYKTDPLLEDTDWDVLNDYEEIEIYKTNPFLRDSDNDSILDGIEVHFYKTNPLSNDTDNDGYNDAWEIANNHNPNRKDNWDQILGRNIFIPVVSAIMLLLMIFAILEIRPLPSFNWRQNNNQSSNLHILHDLISILPSNETLDIKKLVELTGYSQNKIKNILSKAFNDHSINLQDVVIRPVIEKALFNYTCFYCGMDVKANSVLCNYCGQKIVHCKICNRIINDKESYSMSLDYKIIGNKNNIYGIFQSDIICDYCSFREKFRYV